MGLIDDFNIEIIDHYQNPYGEIYLNNIDNSSGEINLDHDFNLSHISIDDFNTSNQSTIINYLNREIINLELEYANNFILGDKNDNKFISNINSPYKNFYYASDNNDTYIGLKNKLEVLNYDTNNIDLVSGLIVTNSSDDVFLQEDNNLFKELLDNDDNFLIFKDNFNLDDFDNLKDFDIIRLTEKDDQAILKGNNEKLIIDFNKGDDTLVLHSYTPELTAENYINLEKLVWHPLNTSENREDLSIEFDVFEVYEGQEKVIPIGDYITNAQTEKEKNWEINYFQNEELGKKDIPNWITIDSVDPSVSLIGAGNIVISFELEKDEENDQLTWIKIYANDLRDNAPGLLGLELDLNMNNSIFSIDEDLYTLTNIFDSNKLPLFRNKGSIKKSPVEDNKLYISGLGAASLPKANQGEILGLSDSSNNNTLFAKIPLRNFDDEIHSKKDLDLNIEIKLMPQVGGEIIDLDKVLILDNKASSVDVLRLNPDDKDIKSYAFSLEEKNHNEVKNIILSLREINDNPKFVNRDNEIILNATQDSPFLYNLSDKFFDVDDIELDYEIINAPNWIVLDELTNSLIGTPKNINVGNNNLILKVSDGRGGEIEKEIKILVQNINDSPFLNKEILLPEIFQDQKFDFLIPQNSFDDPDFLISSEEKLDYSILDNNGTYLESDFITFNEEENILNFSPTQMNIGSHEFRLRATDKDGKYAEQLITLNIKNKNDAPVFTTSFETFKSFQTNSLDLNLVSEEERKNLIFIDSKTSLDLNSWVNDIDKVFDINESLTFHLEIMDNEGQVFEINNNNDEKYNWISLSKNILEINATENNIGSHFIRFSASDSSNETITSLFNINVRHKNRAPIINENFLSDDIFNIKGKGILNSTVSNNFIQDDSSYSKVLLVSLEEESEINFKLPKSLFLDPDLLLDENEKLSIKLIGSEELFNNDSKELNVFTFDEDNLSIFGSTIGLAIDKSNGAAIWKNKLIAEDNYGKSTSIDLIFSLQRTALKPSVEILNEINDFEEGNIKTLNEFININNVSRTGDRLFMEISQVDTNPYKLDLFSDNIFIEEAYVNNKPVWKINGNWNNIDNLLNNLKLKTSNNFGFGEFKLEVKAYSELGLTSLRSEVSNAIFDIYINPKVDAPVWIDNTNDDFLLEDFNFSSLGDVFKAELIDYNEKLSYRISFDNDLDLEFSNKFGEELGLKIENSFIFNENEWQDLIIRNKSETTNLIDLKIEALSYSNVLRKFKASDYRLIKWKPIPLIEIDPNINIITDITKSKSGEIINLDLDLNIPPIAKSSLLALKLKEGSELILNNEVIMPENKIDSDEYYYLNFNQNSQIVRLQIRNPDIFNGLYEGEISIYSSVKDDLNKSYLEHSIFEDVKNKLTTKNEKNIFSWEVSQVAFSPEFNSDNLEKFGYDPITGKLNLEIRRGSSLSGQRNPREALILGIQNVPNGYQLVNKVDDKYIVFGATDEFGTFTIINIPPLPFDTEQNQIANFNLINEGNLFLIPNDKKVSPLNNHKLKFLLSSRIIDNSIGDTSSEVVSEELYLNSSNTLPVLNEDRFIDPLIIDFNNDGIQFLDINDLENNIRFNMIPTKGNYKTSWITNTDANPFDNAFLALNDTKNDDGDIKILSINELFSEYFKSENITRNYLSGTDALLSLDVNNDKIIDHLDDSWSEILLWFDNGDGISQKEELLNVENFLSKIDLNTKENLSVQPSWSSSNILLSQSNAYSKSPNENVYKIYDVGLENYSGDFLNEKIDIELLSKNEGQNEFSKNNNLITNENDDQAFLKIISPLSSSWIEDGIDSLTLIRLSGLPNEITLPLGLKDSIGDWVFTWEDYKNNDYQLNLIANDYWSGNFPLNVLVSQIQADGSLRSSISKTINVEITPVANKPYLNTKNIIAKEDELFSIQDLISSYGLRDNDGSEKLVFKLTDLPQGTKIFYKEGLEEIKSNENGVFVFDSDEINNIGIQPAENFSGILQFAIKLVAIENGNLSEAEITKNVQVNIDAIPDKPKDIIFVDQTNKNGLIQNQSIRLLEIINPISSNNFEDNDGSEEKLIEIAIDDSLILRNSINDSWNPILNNNSDGISKYVFKFEDLENLILIDNGINAINKIDFEASLISKEKSNGKSNRGNISKISINFHRNAKDPFFKNIELINLNEDFDFYNLSNFVDIEPYLDDSIEFVIDNLNSTLNIFDLDKNIIERNENNEIILNASLDNFFIKSIPNISGNFSFNIRSIATPPGLGLSKESSRKKLDLSINPIADIPIINFEKKDDFHNIESNGWFDLGKLNLNINSNDNDNSENYFLKIGYFNEKGQVNNLPDSFRLNVDLTKNNEGYYEIPEELLNDLNLYLGIIPENIELALIPISTDDNSRVEGEKVLLKISSNEVLKFPLLNIAFNPNFDEDTRVPLLKENGGPIEANLVSSAGSQTLEIEFSEIPANAKIQKRVLDGDETNWITLSDQLSSLIIPYEEAKDLFFQPPKDHTGNIEITVRALSFDSARNSKSSNPKKVNFNFNPINDAPFVIDASDLDKVLENYYKEWDLLKIFEDVDNNKSEIEIKSINQIIENENRELPQWLKISNEGFLSGIPLNQDVGFYEFYITANDPSGLESSVNINLEVGNTNSSPFLTNYIPKSWTLNSDDNGEYIFKTVDLNDELILNPVLFFDDDDFLHNEEKHIYSISTNLVDWDENISDLAKLRDGQLIIKPTTKSKIGDQIFYLKASDINGTSVLQKIALFVNDINEAPVVIKKGANLVSQNRWQEEIFIKEDEDFNFDLNNLFVDNDQSDVLALINPSNFPSWLKFNLAKNNYGGTLEGVPKNNDIGAYKLIWQAIDLRGQKSIYELIINVENTNDSPSLKINPDYSNFGEIINGIPSLLEGEYTSLDLSKIFSDDDLIHGDNLNYEIIEISKDDNVIDNQQEWLDIVYRSTTPKSPEGKLYIEPVFYKYDDSLNLIRIENNELASLQNGTELVVSIQLIDNRNILENGVLGIDLDIIIGESLELIKESASLTNKLPLFNSILESNNSIRIEAGALPEIGQGDYLGIDEFDEIISFKTRLKNSQENIFLGISQGKGINRDGITGRNQEIFTDENSVFYSYSSRDGADLHIMAPKNNDVGKYNFKINAIDSSGSAEIAFIPFEILNKNDKPFVNKNTEKFLKDLFDEEYFENFNFNTGPLSLFSDDDLIHNSDNLTFQIIQGDINNKINNDLYAENILNIEKTDNKISNLSFKVPLGLTNDVSQEFKLKAIDSEGEEVETDWFNLFFKPKADLTNITGVNDNEIIDLLSLGILLNKNMSIDLSRNLGINSLDPNDILGDKIFLNIQVGDQEAYLKNNVGDNPIIDNGKINEIGEKQFRIDLNNLSEISGNPLGNISGLELIVSPNKFEEKPSQLENVYSINNENEPVKTGIAIDIWTETEVNSIETKYPSVSSNVSTIWIPIDNNQAEFLPSRPINIDETFFEIDSNYILDMNEYFYDPDQDETIGWKLNLPRKIRDLIFIENESGKVLFTEKVKSFEDLPLGIHKIICERKDSSHSFGQKSGMSRGVIRLAFRSNKSENIIKGIDLLREADTSSLEAIVKNQKESLSEAESNVLEILDKLKLKNENEKLSFIEKISIGKVALLETTEDQKVIKLDSTNSSGALFLESSTSNTSEEMDLKINNIYKSPNINMPLGEIDFSLDTNSAESSIVFIDVLDLETNINSIVKTNVFDEPSLFQSTQLTYEESVDGSLQEWLDSLEFNLNYYALPNSGMNIELESLKINMNDTLSEKLSSIGFSEDHLPYIDGSSYLLDTDNDGLVDKIGLLLIDQGYFDLNRDIGFIRDPIIPILFEVIETPETSQNLGNETIEASSSIIPQDLSLDNNYNINNLYQNSSVIEDISGEILNKNNFSYISNSQINKEAENIKLKVDETNFIFDNSSVFKKLKKLSKLLSNSFDLAKDFASRLVDSPLESFLLIMLGGISSERILTKSIDTLTKDRNLKIKRRNELFQGRWIYPTRDSRFLAIEMFNSKIKILNINDMDEFVDKYSVIPGIDHEGKSLLSEILHEVINPGIFIKEISILLKKLSHGEQIDINWNQWINKYFLDDKLKGNLESKSKEKIRDLKSILSKADKVNVSMTDVLMYAQFIDVARELKIDLNI